MMSKLKRRKSTLAERTTSCACCGYPISHRHHLMGVAPHGENRHTAQFCPNCHELFHIVQASIVRESRYCSKVLRQYTEAKGMDDPAFKFMLSKVFEVEDLQETFTRNAPKITETVHEQLALYVPMLTDLDILGVFDAQKESTGVQFKVGTWVSAKNDNGSVSESLWVFHFSGAKITKAETLQVNRDAKGSFIPVMPLSSQG